MTPATIVKQSLADGVTLSVGDGGKIKFSGKEDQVAKWLPLMRQHKISIFEFLSKAANDLPDTAEATVIDGTRESETEESPVLATAFSQSASGAELFEPFGRYGNERLCESNIEACCDSFLDDRRTCSQCINLHSRVCAIAEPGGLVSARKGYKPGEMFREQLHRCEGYDGRLPEK